MNLNKNVLKMTGPIYPFLFCLFLLFGVKTSTLKAQEILADKNATPQTKALYRYLFDIQQSGKILLGHHDALAYGHGWKDELGRSDVKEVTGSHPAVCSMDFGKIEHKNSNNINGIPFDKMREIIRYAHKRGQVIMMCWHVDNPKTHTAGSRYPVGTSWDNSDNAVVREILQEESPLNLKFKGWLDNLAEYIHTLTDDGGNPIPFIFRPWHEHTQGWNWWGSKCATDEEFIDLWKFTIRYLRDQKGIHHMIYAISPQMDHVYPNVRERLLYRWPGDNEVDFIGVDCYHGRNKEAFASNVKGLSALSEEKGKPCGVTETGIESVNYPTYFTEEILPVLEKNHISMIVFWRNDSRSQTHFYIPFKGHSAEADFLKFVQSPGILLEKDMPKRLLVHGNY
ncbi:MAG: glycoside hydrolase family 26 protein [Bacteroidales bacterium]|nr:glycoside hydrolase family 26 protein [Bacteroidales bacterium]